MPEPFPNVIGGFSGGLAQGMSMGLALRQQKMAEEQAAQQQAQREQENAIKRMEYLGKEYATLQKRKKALYTSDGGDSLYKKMTAPYAKAITSEMAKLFPDSGLTPEDIEAFYSSGDVPDYVEQGLVNMHTLWTDKDMDIGTKQEAIRNLFLDALSKAQAQGAAKEDISRLEGTYKGLSEDVGGVSMGLARQRLIEQELLPTNEAPPSMKLPSLQQEGAPVDQPQVSGYRQKITDLLKAYPDKTPAEIVEIVKGKAQDKDKYVKTDTDAQGRSVGLTREGQWELIPMPEGVTFGKEKEYAPQMQLLKDPKTGKKQWFDMNNKADIARAQTGGWESEPPSANVFVGTDPVTGMPVVMNTRGEPNIRTTEGPTNIQPKTAPTTPSEQAVALQQVDTLQEALIKVKEMYRPEYVGIISGPAGKLQEKTGIGADPQRAEFRSYVANLYNTVIYLRSGKQINEQEAKRLLDELPSMNTSPVDFNAKLKKFEWELNSIAKNRREQLRQGGYRNVQPYQPSGIDIKSMSDEDLLKELGK